MNKKEFITIFNMGRSYSNMPEGFNELIKQHWKYRDADEAFAIFSTGNYSLSENKKLISRMCININPDFDLLPELMQDDLIINCKRWLRAYENNLQYCL